MKKAFVAALALLASPLGAQGSSNEGLPGWLAGAWIMEDGADWADATWTSPRGGMMMGAVRTGFGPDVNVWEFTRIERKPGGAVVFLAQPKGKEVTEFPLAVSSPLSIEFANPAHDFPQRIRYERVGQLLIAEFSRMDGSDTVRMQFRMTEQGAGERF